MVFLAGSGHHNSNIELLLNDQLASMGDAITNEIGTIAWIEAYVMAEALNGALNFVDLMSNQLTPSDISVFAQRWASIFNLSTAGNALLPSNLPTIQRYISFKQALFGTFPNVGNVSLYIQDVLGPIFIDLEYVYEIQSTATHDPQVQIIQDGYEYFSPLSQVLVRVWQPRDNQDHFYMPNNVFFNTVDSYKAFVQDWVPANIAVRNMQLIYPGDNGNSNYFSNINTISISAGTNLIIGHNGTRFTHDFDVVNALGYLAPIEVVDDNNELQTFLINNVISDTEMTITTLPGNNVSNRTYRLLGVEFDTSQGLDAMLFGQIEL